MALIEVGDISELSVTARPRASATVKNANSIKTFGVLADTAPQAPAEAFDFAVSTQSRGLALERLLLQKNFQGGLGRLLDRRRKVYFLAWAWDFSGKPVYFYPGGTSPAGTTLIPIKAEQEREFLGAGVLLSPPRPITGGLAVRLHLWISNSDTRRFGETMVEVSETIKQSEVNTLLAVIATAGGLTTASVSAAWMASLELSSVIGKILEARNDSHIDFYEGFFPAKQRWSPKSQAWKANASEITLARLR